MKTAIKLLTALAAVAGAVYVVATYGDKIVAWAKKITSSCPRSKFVTVTVSDEETPTEIVDASAETSSVEEATTEEAPVEEVPVVTEGEPVAEDADFEA